MSINTVPQNDGNSKLTISQAFGRYLTRRYSLSQKTKQIYRQHIARLTAFLNDPLLSDITPDDLALFFNSLRRRDGQPYSPGYLHQIWRSLNTFFNFYKQAISNPLLTIDKPALPSGPKDRLSLLEIDKILHAIDDADTSRFDLRRRNRAIVLLMVDSGIRLNEIVTIKLTDLDLVAREVTVHDSKVSKTRVVPISKPTRNAIIAYLDERPNGSKLLFLNADESDITDRAIIEMVRRLKYRSGIDRLHPHLFRHTFARHYINRGELQKLSQILGHSDVRTTANYYAAADLDAIKAEFELACPTAQLEQAGGGQKGK